MAAVIATPHEVGAFNLKITGTWEINANLFKGLLVIRTQDAGGHFEGTLTITGEPTDTVSGTINGPGDGTTPTTIMFTRTRAGGTFSQKYTGSVVQISGQRMMAGTFSHQGRQPFPWYAAP